MSGLGADEQLGGYARHMTVWRRGGWDKLEEEIGRDVARLPSRNLGRDDRVIGALGKEVRYPFLDEGRHVVPCFLARSSKDGS